MARQKGLLPPLPKGTYPGLFTRVDVPFTSIPNRGYLMARHRKRKVWEAEPAIVELKGERMGLANFNLLKHLGENDDLTTYEYAVAVSIALHRDAELCDAYPSLERIAECSKCSLATAKRAVKSLHEKGIVWSKTKHRVSTRYYFTFDDEQAREIGAHDDF